MLEHFIAMQIRIEHMKIPQEYKEQFLNLMTETAKTKDPIKLLDNVQRDEFRHRLKKKQYVTQF